MAQPFLEPIVEQMTTVFDPEIELDIYNLGLIYEITVDENGHCHFLMTFTDTGWAVKRLCLMKSQKLKSIDGINSVKVENHLFTSLEDETRISRYGRIAFASHLEAEIKGKPIDISKSVFLRLQQIDDHLSSYCQQLSQDLTPKNHIEQMSV